MKKTLLATVLGLTLAVSASAADYYITGATAFRASFYRALEGNGWTCVQGRVTGGTVCSPPSIGNQFTFTKGADTIYCSFSGSVEGIGSVCSGTPVPNFLNKSTGAKFSAVAALTFSDVCIESTSLAYGGCSVVDATVGIQPFVFAMNDPAYNDGIRNMTSQSFGIFGGTGTLLEQYLLSCGTANPCVFNNNTVYLTGRNSYSGTRTVTFSETGYGVFSPCQQWHNGTTYVDANGRTARTTPNVAGAVAHIANDGWESGSYVRADLQNGICTVPFIGYISAGDARTIKADAATSSTRYLTYNGNPYTKCGVMNGQYTLWSHEHLYAKDHSYDAFVTEMQTAIDTYLTGCYCTDAWPGAIPESAMNVFRTCEGGYVQ